MRKEIGFLKGSEGLNPYFVICLGVPFGEVLFGLVGGWRRRLRVRRGQVRWLPIVLRIRNGVV